MRQYKIYQRSLNEKREVTIGSNSEINTKIFVGTSKSNSHDFLDITVRCIEAAGSRIFIYDINRKEYIRKEIEK